VTRNTGKYITSVIVAKSHWAAIQNLLARALDIILCIRVFV